MKPVLSLAAFPTWICVVPMARTGWNSHDRQLALGGTFLMESLCHLHRPWAKLRTGEILCWHSKLKHQIYSCSAESENECLSFWNKIMGRSGWLLWRCEKSTCSAWVHKAETSLSDFIYWNPLKLFYISEIWIDWGVREQSFVQSRFPPWNAPSEPNKLFQLLGKQQKLGNNIFIHGSLWKGEIMAKYPVLLKEF